MELTYGVQLGSFQGPVDALLKAARSQDVALSEVDLAALVRDFGRHLNDRSGLDVGPISGYLLVFSELIRIKTRLLLPDSEEDETREDPPEESSEDFLAVAARVLRERAEQRARMYDGHPPELPEEVRSGKTQYREVTLVELIRSFKKLMETERDPRAPDLKITDEFDTEQRMDYILQRVTTRDAMPFEALLGSEPTREEIVVTLLAVLQLVKQNAIRLVRPREGGVIRVIKTASDMASSPMRETA